MAFTAEWRGQSDTHRRRFLAVLFASGALHLPVSPLVVLLGLLGLLSPQLPAGSADPNELTAIPIDLLADEDTERGGGERVAAQRTEEVLAPAEPDPIPAPATTAAIDAGAPEEDAGVAAQEDAGSDAGIDAGGDAGELDAADAGDAGSEEGPAPPKVRNPVALAAKESSVVDSNAVIQLTVYPENFRDAPLGARMGQLLANLPQWQDFFGPAGLDPVANIDRMMLVGPDLADSSGLAVLIQHRLPPARMRGAVDALVRRSRGSWLEGKVPAAVARADQADRVFVMPSPTMVVVAPMSARDSALAFPASARVPPPEGDEALYGALRQPGFALEKHGAPIRLPPSVVAVEFWVQPAADGGAIARVVVKDASPEDAERTLESLRSQIDTLRMAGGLAGLGSRLFGGRGARLDAKDLQLFVVLLGGLDLSVHGAEIHGTVTASRPVVELLLGRIERQFRIAVPTPPPRTSAAAPATSRGLVTPSVSASPVASAEGAGPEPILTP